MPATGSGLITFSRVGVFYGPSPWSSDPIVLCRLGHEGLEVKATLEAMQTMQHECADWFVPSVQPYSVNAQVDASDVLCEFLTDWALQVLNFVRGHLQSRGSAKAPSPTYSLIWVGHHEPQITTAVLDLGVKWMGACLRRLPQEPFKAALAQIWRYCRKHHPDFQATMVIEAARYRGVPFSPAWGLARHWRFGEGTRSRVLFETSSCSEGSFGARVAASKSVTKGVLQSLGLPTAPFAMVNSEAELSEAVQQVGFPCAVKPIDRSGGKGVSAGLTSTQAVNQAYAAARQLSTAPIMVERHVEGDDHRVMVVEGRLLACIRREPPCVTGDGKSSIRELVELINRARDERSLAKSRYLRPVLLDASAELHLAGQGLRLDEILEDGRTVRVRSNANLATGGHCVDLTARMHPDIRVMAESLAQTLNLPMLGVDYLTTDITKTPGESGGRFIEINATPGLVALTASGWSSREAGDVALGSQVGRIAQCLVVVDETDKSSTEQELRQRHWPAGSGWASWECASLAGAELSVTTKVPWPGFNALMGQRMLHEAVVLVTKQQLSAYGLPTDVFRNVEVRCALDEAWISVLRRHCPRDVQFPGSAEFFGQ